MKTTDPRTTHTLGRALALTAVLTLAVLGAGDPVLADGGAGGGNGGGSTPSRAEHPDYAAGVAAIKASDYPKAIKLMESVVARDGQNADAYNWLAYAVRRNGDPAKAIPIYEKALSIDGKHRGAHEYIGEAYLALDNLPKAKEHLKRLDSLCFFPCSEYRDLKAAVEAYERSGGRVKPSAGR